MPASSAINIDIYVACYISDVSPFCIIFEMKLDFKKFNLHAKTYEYLLRFIWKITVIMYLYVYLYEVCYAER